MLLRKIRTRRDIEIDMQTLNTLPIDISFLESLTSDILPDVSNSLDAEGVTEESEAISLKQRNLKTY